MNDFGKIEWFCIAVILWLAACVPGLVAESRDAALYASQRAAVEKAFGVK